MRRTPEILHITHVNFSHLQFYATVLIFVSSGNISYRWITIIYTAEYLKWLRWIEKIVESITYLEQGNDPMTLIKLFESMKNLWKKKLEELYVFSNIMRRKNSWITQSVFIKPVQQNVTGILHALQARTTTTRHHAQTHCTPTITARLELSEEATWPAWFMLLVK